MRSRTIALGALLAGCKDKAETSDTGAPAWAAPEGGVISLETRDDVTLAADYYPVDQEGAGAVLLLHMNPEGGYTRADWPAELIEGYNAADLAVIALDRRGAGDSEGDPKEAWYGPSGRYDVEAAALKLAADGYGALQILGASNGTTSMIDYAAWAPGEGLPEPAALGFLTGGAYTETNTYLDDVAIRPTIFVYSDAEAEWSNIYNQENEQPDLWEFHQIPDGGHGTEMFDGPEAPLVIDLLLDFAQTY